MRNVETQNVKKAPTNVETFLIVLTPKARRGAIYTGRGADYRQFI